MVARPSTQEGEASLINAAWSESLGREAFFTEEHSLSGETVNPDKTMVFTLKLRPQDAAAEEMRSPPTENEPSGFLQAYGPKSWSGLEP